MTAEIASLPPLIRLSASPVRLSSAAMSLSAATMPRSPADRAVLRQRPVHALLDRGDGGAEPVDLAGDLFGLQHAAFVRRYQAGNARRPARWRNLRSRPRRASRWLTPETAGASFGAAAAACLTRACRCRLGIVLIIEAGLRILEIADQRLDGLDGVGAVRPHGDFLVLLDRQQHQLDRALGADRLAVLDQLDIGFEALGELDEPRRGTGVQTFMHSDDGRAFHGNTLVLGATADIGGSANAVRRRW